MKEIFKQSYKIWKNAMIMFLQGFVMVVFMVFIPVGMVYGLFCLSHGLNYLLEYLQVLPHVNPSISLDSYPLAVGIFIGCVVSFLWSTFIWTKIYKKRKKNE
jgi:hypothetical protein